MRNFKGFRLLTCMAFALTFASGCWGDEPLAPEPQREVVAEFSLGVHYLKVTGLGSWEDASMALRMEYRNGVSVPRYTTADLVSWTSSDKLRDECGQFLASVEPEFLKYVMSQLNHHTEITDPDMDRLYHYLFRIVNASAADEVQSLEADAEECYCSYCKTHHTPYCR